MAAVVGLVMGVVAGLAVALAASNLKLAAPASPAKATRVVTILLPVQEHRAQVVVVSQLLAEQ